MTNFLNLFFKTDGSNKLTSHSLKDTSLSWASKCGLPEDVRTLLGHHELSSKGMSKSLATYSRDMLSRPLKFYIEMLDQIRRDFFRPDMSRSGWMSSSFRVPSGEHGKPASAPPNPDEQADIGGEDLDVGCGPLESVVASLDLDNEAAIDESSAREADEIFKNAGIDFFNEQAESAEDLDKVEAEKEVYEKDLDSVESSSTSSSSSSEDMNEEELREKLSDQRVAFDFDIDGPLFLNKKSRVLHRTGRSSDVLRCGVKVSSAFLFLERGSFFKWPRCGKCFKGEVLATASQAADMLGAMASRRSRSEVQVQGCLLPANALAAQRGSLRQWSS